MDRRSRAYRDLIRAGTPPPDGRQEVEVIDGIAFEYRGEPRCKVCAADSPAKQLPNGDQVKQLVDGLLVAGATYAGILERIEPLVKKWPEDERPSYDSIRRHQLRHLPADAIAFREILERRAVEQGLRIVVGKGPIVTNAAVFEAVRMFGMKALAAGEIAPTVSELMAAAKTLEAIEREDTASLTVPQLKAQVDTLIEVVQERIGSDWEAVVTEVERRLQDRPALPESSEDQKGDASDVR